MMSISSAFKSNVLRFVKEQEPKHFEKIQKMHTDVIKEIIDSFDDNFKNRVMESIEKGFRYTFNPGSEQGGDINRDSMVLAKGEGHAQYTSLTKGGKSLKYTFEVSYVKGSDRVLIEVDSSWEPGFTGLEQFSNRKIDKINTFPESFVEELNAFGAKHSLQMESFFTDDTRFKLTLEFI